MAFKKLTDTNARLTDRVTIRFNKAERADLEAQARLRAMSVHEYIRRTTTHRRADLRVEHQMILAVRESVAALRDLHVAYTQHGHPPPAELLQRTLETCNTAIIQLGRY